MLTYLLQGVIHNVANGSDIFCLPNSMHAIESLVFDHGVPLRLHKEYMVCSRQIEPRNVNAERD